MSYFPFFIDLTDKQGLIIGGGKIALGKIRRLLPYGPQLTVAAPEFLEEIESMQGILRLKAPFSSDMLDGKHFVIAATDDKAANHFISGLCKQRKILVNVVDDKDACSFLFPSLVKRGKLIVGISTEGASPSAAIYLKGQINDLIPENIDEILEFLDGKRQILKETIPEEKQRSRIFAGLFRMCIEKGRVPTEGEWIRLIQQRGEEGEVGYVYLVGAGCGQADLITVRGLRLLQKCQVLVYDDLIAEELLEEVPDSAQRIYVGKRCGRHSASQEEIGRILIEKAREGNLVVRLKGGDPFVFGRGGEEMEALIEAGIPCEEVPGVTSAIAIPAAAGIPVTHRGLSQSVHIITGHTADTEDHLPRRLEWLAGMEGTLVFLMGLGQLEKIIERLSQSGMDVDTPAAVISGGNSLCPAVARGTLGNIVSETRRKGIKTPAVIVIGETAALELIAKDK